YYTHDHVPYETLRAAYHIGQHKKHRKIGERQEDAVRFASQRFCPGPRSVRDQKVLYPLRSQLAGGELRHLPSADERNGTISEVTQELVSHFHGHAAQRERSAGNLRLGAHSFRCAYRARDRPLQLGAERSRALRLRRRFLHLPEDL